MDSGQTSGPTSRIKGKQRIKECFYVEPACSNIVVQRTVNDHTSYMTRVRAKFKMDGEILSMSLPASTRDYKTPTQYQNVGDYKRWTGLSPPTTNPSTMRYRHI